MTPKFEKKNDSLARVSNIAKFVGNNFFYGVDNFLNTLITQQVLEFFVNTTCSFIYVFYKILLLLVAPTLENTHMTDMQ